MRHLTTEELEAGLPHIVASPPDDGTLELIVRRPAVDEREVLEEGELDLDVGLVGDTWNQRPSKQMPDGSPHPDKQLNIMNARAAALVAGERDRWALAGDQLYVDLDLTDDNLPPGTCLAIGGVVIEITAPPHQGCVKFIERFGKDAGRFVNTGEGKRLHLRGVCARVVQAGTIRPGDRVRKVATVDVTDVAVAPI